MSPSLYMFVFKTITAKCLFCKQKTKADFTRLKLRLMKTCSLGDEQSGLDVSDPRRSWGHGLVKITGNIREVALKKTVGTVFPPSIRLTLPSGGKLNCVSNRNAKSPGWRCLREDMLIV